MIVKRLQPIYGWVSITSGDGDGDGDGGSEGGSEPKGKTYTETEVNELVAGLKTTLGNLKTEKGDLATKVQGLSSQFEKLGGEEGITSLLDMRERLEKDEVGKLLAEGKHEEWLEQRTTAMRSGFENQLEGMNLKVTDAQKIADEAIERMQKTLLRVDVGNASRNLKTADTAVEDIVLAAQQVFEYDSQLDGMVIRDQQGGVIYGPDAKTPKSVSDWLTDQKENRRHWWGSSAGAGAQGSSTGGPVTGSLEDRLATGQMTMTQYRKERQELGFKNY